MVTTKFTRLLLLLLAAGLAGCSRMSATTYVKPDGSFTRVVRFKTSADSSSSSSTPFGGGFRDSFLVPVGSPWIITKAKEKDDLIYAATQRVATGGSIRQDVVLKGDDKQAGARLLDNELTVRVISPGRIEYREVLHWRG